MASKSRNGLLTWLKRSPFIAGLFLFVIGSLIMQAMKKTMGMTKPNNLPADFDGAMHGAFPGSGYPTSAEYNWDAIAKMETAGFTSKLYATYNNPWGMRDGSGRPHHQAGTVQTSNGTFATYDTLQDAAEDIIDWMNAAGFSKAPLTLAAHVAEMGKHGYFGTQSTASYLKLVKEWVMK